MADLNDVLLSLGRLQESVEQLREDFREEKADAKVSRATIHHRLDDQAERIANLNTTVEIAGQVDAQIRDEVKSLSVKVDANQAAADPALADMRRLKAIGVGFTGLLAIAGLSAVTVLMWAGEAFWNWLRYMLRIP